MHIQTSSQPSLALGFGNFTCNWGVHICGLYETGEERDEIIFGFLNKGDRMGDLQLYSPAERTPEDFKNKYRSRYADCAGHVDNADRFQIFTSRELYYPEDVFSPWMMEETLGEFYAASQKNGQRNIRAAAEMAWALETIPGIEQLMSYEARLNYFIPGKPWVSICLYNITKFSGSVIMNVLRTHPCVISGGIITENPYYQHPDRWLAEYAPRFLVNECVRP